MSKGEPTGNFFIVSHTIPESTSFKKLNLSTKLLYYTMCHLRNRFANDDGIFYRSLGELMKDTGLTRMSVVSARNELLKAGLLRWTKGNSRQACYYQPLKEVV